MDEAQKTKLMADCSCGSGKTYGACCGSAETCFCGSGKTAGECCMAAPQEHGVEGGMEEAK